MSAWSCDAFRHALEQALGGSPSSERTRELAWHEHLLGCAHCRALLEAEEALEVLLASLPEPQLPRELAQRVLARLARERGATGDAGLDHLLELAPEPEVPTELGRRVLQGLGAARAEERLDALLDSVPPPEVPPDLAARVLAATRAAQVERRRAGFRLLRGGRKWTAAAAAAAVVAAIFLGLTQRNRTTPAEAVVEDELLVSLDVLENWDVLMTDDLDLMLASMDPADWALLELEEAGDDLEEPGEPGEEEQGG